MHIKLRKITSDDLKTIIDWRMSPNVTKYMYTDPKLNLEGQKVWLKNINSSKNQFYWIIECDNKPIGVVSITDIDYINSRCQWGHYIGDISYRGKGIFSCVECNIYDYVFYNLKLNKLVTEVFRFNKNAIDIHRRTGSNIEGILREHIFKNDKFYDVVVMGITKKMWETKKTSTKYQKIEIE